MKRVTIILFFLVGFCFIYIRGGQPENPHTQILASVGSHHISLAQFADRYTDFLIKSGINDKGPIREKILINMTNELVLRYYDNNKKIFSNLEYQRELKWSKRETVLGYLEDQQVYSKIRVTDAELKEAFVRVNEEVAARHLYAPTKEQADSLYNLLIHGASFDSLAKQDFTDTTLANNGGYLGYFTWGDMDPAFEDAAYTLPIGKISKPVKTAHGYSIIKVEDKVVKPILTQNEFLNKKDHLTQVLRMRKMKPYERAYLKSIIDVSKIKFNKKSLNAIYSDLNYSQPMELKKKLDIPVKCAFYKNKTYFQGRIEDEINEMPRYQKNKITSIEDLEAVIKGLILQDSLYNIAVSFGYDTTKIVDNTYKKLITDVFMRYKINEVMKKASIPDSVVYQYYKDNINSFMSPKEINVQELIVDKKTLADNLREQAENGVDFGSLVDKYSIKKNSGSKKGIVGFADLDKYKYLKDTLWNSPIGKIVGPLRIEKYFGLFKIFGKKASQPMDFNLIKNQVVRSVKKQMQDSLLEKYVDKLKKSVPININYNVLWAYKVPGALENNNFKNKVK